MNNWSVQETERDSSKDKKSRVYTFLKSSNSHVKKLLEMRDDDVDDGIISALMVCTNSSIKAERLSDVITDFSAEPDILGLLSDPDVLDELMHIDDVR